MIVRGRVKWFDIAKGYGFVVADDHNGDILLHSNVLKVFGFTSVAEGAEIVVQVQKTERGRQAVEVVDILPSPEAAPPPEFNGAEASELEPARVKWFDRGKGFGFVNIFGKPEDVFLHMEVLRQFGYGEVTAGDVLAVRVSEGARGPMVHEVRSWDYVVRHRPRTDGPRRDPGDNPDDQAVDQPAGQAAGGPADQPADSLDDRSDHAKT